MSLVRFKSSNHPQQVAARGATSRDDLGTDPALFAQLDERFGFTLDVAATAANAKCERYFDLEADGLAQSWTGERVWCNPPYSQIGAWVAKAWREWHRGYEWSANRYATGDGAAELIVMLLPANRTEQTWWQEHVEPAREHSASALRVEFLRGRQRFVLPGAETIGPNERPPFGSCLLIWRRGVLYHKEPE